MSGSVVSVTRGSKNSDAHCRLSPLPSRSWARPPTRRAHSVGGGECARCVGPSRTAVALRTCVQQVCQDHHREARTRMCIHNPCDAWLLQTFRGKSGGPMDKAQCAGHLQVLIRYERARSSDLHVWRVRLWRCLERLYSHIHQSRGRQIWSKPSTGIVVLGRGPIAVAVARYESP